MATLKLGMKSSLHGINIFGERNFLRWTFLQTNDRKKERKNEREWEWWGGEGRFWKEQRAAISVSKLFQRRLKIQMNWCVKMSWWRFRIVLLRGINSQLYVLLWAYKAYAWHSLCWAMACNLRRIVELVIILNYAPPFRRKAVKLKTTWKESDSINMRLATPHAQHK